MIAHGKLKRKLPRFEHEVKTNQLFLVHTLLPATDEQYEVDGYNNSSDLDHAPDHTPQHAAHLPAGAARAAGFAAARAPAPPALDEPPANPAPLQELLDGEALQSPPSLPILDELLPGLGGLPDRCGRGGVRRQQGRRGGQPVPFLPVL